MAAALPTANRSGSAPRTASSVSETLRRLLAAGDLDLPRPAGGQTGRRWAALAGWGRSDLALARLAEGHTDAVAILAEAGRPVVPGALYGVWAARPGGVGARLERRTGGLVLDGTVRYCSGATSLDRALVVADPEGAGTGAPVLVDVGLAHRGVHPDPASWQAAGMDAADTLDVRFDAVPVDTQLGGPGWYTGRPGFIVGGAGVAAVWWGGAAGLLDKARFHLERGPGPDAHQLAHLGELHALLAAADALLQRTATEIDAAPAADHRLAVATVRTVVERAAREVVDRVPRILGPTPLSRDAALARQLVDLQIYLRQHHGERDHAALGAQLLDLPEAP
ncbi:acyl-CoA dehydrogenase family protein [Pseudonocardia acidicola]|uniref:Acyl-CoA dehydrogenase n=1 Tax=Pseudonocardia acidicola TaxID=2724939 RepID=A0ABX1SBH5_9PSEU|nr:acyl-CoA dehydrogenase family protein [Pseudonocardia acidicola]NMH98915.1 acyl-CoA dehydrogenase [Pseudonocardia acidicola]